MIGARQHTALVGFCVFCGVANLPSSQEGSGGWSARRRGPWWRCGQTRRSKGWDGDASRLRIVATPPEMPPLLLSSYHDSDARPHRAGQAARQGPCPAQGARGLSHERRERRGALRGQSVAAAGPGVELFRAFCRTLRRAGAVENADARSGGGLRHHPVRIRVGSPADREPPDQRHPPQVQRPAHRRQELPLPGHHLARRLPRRVYHAQPRRRTVPRRQGARPVHQPLRSARVGAAHAAHLQVPHLQAGDSCRRRQPTILSAVPAAPHRPMHRAVCRQDQQGRLQGRPAAVYPHAGE